MMMVMMMMKMKNIMEKNIHLLGGLEFIGQFMARYILLTLLLQYFSCVRSIYFQSYGWGR
jgi:hypothetical protein